MEEKKYEINEKNQEIKNKRDIKRETDEINDFLRKKQNKQILLILVFIFSIISLIFISITLNNFSKKFNYINLEFTKTKTGEVNFFSTYVPLTNVVPVTGSFIKKDQITGKFPLNLRNDPRKLEYILVDIPNDTVIFKGNIVYITMNAEDKPCEQNIISAVTLSGFLTDFASFKVEGAVTDKEYAEKNKVPYITCNNSNGNTVIWLKEGNETSIKKTNPYCYELTYKNCEMLPVSEKFILTILSGYMSFFEGGEKLKRPIIPNNTHI
ncbi:MAG: hypothetical protein QXW97_01325 [Candidatus Pacearchaeota archaeon]